jgi:hypothetical protein
LHRHTRLADGSAANNGHLPLLWWGCHFLAVAVAGFGRRS